MPIRYRIIPVHPEAHLYRVECRVREPASDGQVFSLPAWIPGSYMIRDFAKNIVELEAFSDGAAVSVEKTDKQTWRCAPCAGELILRYSVYAWDLSVRSAHLDQTHAYFNGTSVFLAVEGAEEHRCEVEILRPERDYAKSWRVATGLLAHEVDEEGFGVYSATDYDELIDCPVEMADLAVLEFEACEVPHRLAIYGRLHSNVDLQRLKADLSVICEHHIRFFGGKAPMSDYTFLLTVVGDGYGGLEHRNSSSNMCKRDDLPRTGQTGVSDGYRTLLGLLSHEYFHTWNVKRIKPAPFSPYDLSREVHTQQMWVFEGITSFYDDLSLVRCGLITPSSYLELVGRTLSRVWRGSGRLKQTILESSYDTWTKFYKQDENAPNAIVSYYAKGALIALALDLTIRYQSDNRYSLDHVMRELWSRYGLTGRGLEETEMETLCQSVTSLNLSDFFDHALRSTQDLDLADLFAQVGVELCWRPQNGQSDQGGLPSEEMPKSWLGARIDPSTKGGARLVQVFDDGPAQSAGLSAGDEIVAIGGYRVSGADLEKKLAEMSLGTDTEVTVFRRDELMRMNLHLGAAPSNTAYFEIRDEESLRQWLTTP